MLFIFLSDKGYKQNFATDMFKVKNAFFLCNIYFFSKCYANF